MIDLYYRDVSYDEDKNTVMIPFRFWRAAKADPRERVACAGIED